MKNLNYMKTMTRVEDYTILPEQFLKDCMILTKYEINKNYIKEEFNDSFIHKFSTYGNIEITSYYGDETYHEVRDEFGEVQKIYDFMDLVDFIRWEPVKNELRLKYDLTKFDNYYYIKDRYDRVLFALRVVDHSLMVRYLNHEPKIYKKFFGLCDFYIHEKIYDASLVKIFEHYKNELLFKYPMFLEFKDYKYINDSVRGIFKVYSFSKHHLGDLLIDVSMFRNPSYTFGQNLSALSGENPYNSSKSKWLKDLDVEKLVMEQTYELQ